MMFESSQFDATAASPGGGDGFISSLTTDSSRTYAKVISNKTESEVLN